MAIRRYVATPAEIPPGDNYVLVMYGHENGDARHSRGVTKTVAFPVEGDENAPFEFELAVQAASDLADSEGIRVVYIQATY